MSNFSSGRIAATSGILKTVKGFVFIFLNSLLISSIIVCLTIMDFWPGFFSSLFFLIDRFFGSLSSFEGLFRSFNSLINGISYLFYEFVKQYGIWHILSASIASFVLSCGIQIYIFTKKAKYLVESELVRGSRLLNAKSFKVKIKQSLKRVQSEFKKDGATYVGFKGGMYGKPFIFDYLGTSLPQYFLTRATMLVGVPGSGKTTIINHALDRARSAGEKCFILDPNGEFYSKFGRENDKILSLYDTRSEKWEAHREEYDGKNFSFSKYAEFLVAEGKGEKIWWGGAREVLKFIFKNTNSLDEIKNYILNLDKGALKYLEDLARGIAGAPDSKQEAGVAAGALLELSFLFDINTVNKSSEPFSIYDWAQNSSKDWVFVVYSDDDRSMSAPLMKIWTNLAIYGILSRQEGDSKNIPVNIVIDEMGDVGTLDMLPSALRRVRKYQGHIYLGLQSLSQFYALHPKHLADDMISQIGNKFFMRVSNPSEARVVSEHIGKSEVIEVRESRSLNEQQKGSGSVSLSKSDRKDIAIAHTEEIRSLPDGHFFLKCLDISPLRSRIRYKNWQRTMGLHKENHCYPEVTQSEKFRSYILGLGQNVEPTNETKQLVDMEGVMKDEPLLSRLAQI